VRKPSGNVPVPYAGQDVGCALGETVFHDLADDPWLQQAVLRSDLLTLRASTMSTTRDVALADLWDQTLTSYGSHREHVIATGPTAYPVTQLWSQRAWDDGVADGLVWNSRRTRNRLTFLLFMPYGGRRGVNRRRDIDAAAPPLSLFDAPELGEVMTAASANAITVLIP